MHKNADPRVERVIEVVQTLIGLSGLTQREIGRRLRNGREYLVRRVLQGDADLKVGQLFELADAIEIHPLELMKMVFASSPEPSALVRKMNAQVELLTALRAADSPRLTLARAGTPPEGDHRSD
jgi:transcriptional regulator with XRE-family HTH domain